MEAAARSLVEQIIATGYRVSGLKPSIIGGPGFPHQPLGKCDTPEKGIRAAENPERRGMKTTGPKVGAEDLL